MKQGTKNVIHIIEKIIYLVCGSTIFGCFVIMQSIAFDITPFNYIIFISVCLFIVILLFAKRNRKVPVRITLIISAVFLAFLPSTLIIVADQSTIELQIGKPDRGKAAYIQAALQTYITESDDVNLTFGGKNTDLTVDSIIEILQKEIKFEGNIYGPYIKSMSSPPKASDYYPEKYKGYEIIINKRALENVLVKPINRKSELKIINDK